MLHSVRSATANTSNKGLMSVEEFLASKGLGVGRKPTLTLVPKTAPSPAFLAELERRNTARLNSKLAMAKTNRCDETPTTASSSERQKFVTPDDDFNPKGRYRGCSWRNAGRKPHKPRHWAMAQIGSIDPEKQGQKKEEKNKKKN